VRVTRDVPFAALSECALEQRDGLAQFTPHALEIRELDTSPQDAQGVIERFGDPDRLFSLSVAFVEYAAFCERVDQGGASHEGGRNYEPEPLTRPVVVQRPDHFPGDILGPAIVA
jgi:hypothetical protein